MADPVSIVTNAIKMVQKLRDVLQKIKDVQTLNLVADLNLALVDLKMQVADLQEENLKLKSDLKTSRQGLSYRERLILENGLYFLKEADVGRGKGPYCTRCFDVDEKLVLVASLPPYFKDVAKYTCPNCKAHY